MMEGTFQLHDLMFRLCEHTQFEHLKHYRFLDIRILTNKKDEHVHFLARTSYPYTMFQNKRKFVDFNQTQKKPKR